MIQTDGKVTSGAGDVNQSMQWSSAAVQVKGPKEVKLEEEEIEHLKSMKHGGSPSGAILYDHDDEQSMGP